MRNLSLPLALVFITATVTVASSSAAVPTVRPGLPQPGASSPSVIYGPPRTIYVSDYIQSVIYILARDTSGGYTKTGLIGGSLTGLHEPTQITLDRKGNIYVADAGSGEVSVFAKGAHGNVAPLSVLQVGYRPNGVKLDAASRILVTGGNAANLAMYAANASGAASPTATNSSGLSNPGGIAVDAAGTIYVPSSSFDSVVALQLDDQGNLDQVAKFGGRLGVSNPAAVAVFGNLLFVASSGNNAVVVYDTSEVGGSAAGAGGTTIQTSEASPIYRITGGATRLDQPNGIAVDNNGRIYVTNYQSKEILIFPAGAQGNVAPSRIIQGSTFGAGSFTGIALLGVGGPPPTPGPSPTPVRSPAIFVNTYGSVGGYASDATGNAAPVTSVLPPRGTYCNLVPQSIAIDPGGEIMAPCVGKIFVYGRGPDGNLALRRTIDPSYQSFNVKTQSGAFAYDAARSELYVSATNCYRVESGMGITPPCVLVIPSSASGYVTPSRVIASGGYKPIVLADAAGNVYVINGPVFTDRITVRIFGVDNNGPTETRKLEFQIAGLNTLEVNAAAFDASGLLYVAVDHRVDIPLNGVTESTYPTTIYEFRVGTNNLQLIRTLGGNLANLQGVNALFVDSKGYLYTISHNVEAAITPSPVSYGSQIRIFLPAASGDLLPTNVIDLPAGNGQAIAVAQ